MEYTIREMIALKGRVLEETDYALSRPDMLDFRLLSGDFFEWNGGKLRFKECVDVADYAQTAAAFPPFEKVRYKSREKFPYLIDNLDTLLDAWKRGEAVAVEGGPCLFGENEVIVSVRLKSGETRLFDYASGEAYLGESSAPPSGEEPPASPDTAADVAERESLADYLRRCGADVEEISFEREKDGLTPQEYLNLRYPFEIAAALGGPLVISIPDMSYRKYLSSVLEFVPETLRKRTLEEYDEISRRITDFYLEVVDSLQARFRIASFACVHGGNREALERWYDRRAPYIEKRRFLLHLTRKPEKLESVKDYVSMPALPWYLFDAENILEMNNMTETDSYRKCKSAHKKVANMGCLLLPHLLSRDGVHTFYSGPLEWKDYGRYDSLFWGA